MVDWITLDWQWGWLMEFTKNEIVHFHIFLEAPALAAAGWIHPRWIERVSRRGKPTDIVRGPFDVAARSAWLESIPKRTAAAEAFNRGGIVELFRSPDAAARYVAKEAAKRHQKELPEGLDPQGRWWWLSEPGKPIQVADAFYVADRNLPQFKRCFDKRAIALAWLDAESDTWDETYDRSFLSPSTLKTAA